MDVIKFKIPKHLSALIALTFLFWSPGCAPKKDVREDVLDTPQHHVSSGFKLLKKDYIFHAEREFLLALELDPQSWNAHRGLGLVYAGKSQFSLALTHMRKAEAGAKTDVAQALVDVGFMRIYMQQGAEDWFDQVCQSYSDALSHDPALPDPYYYMGMAFKKLNRLSEARRAFKKVIEIDKGLVAESQQELRAIDRFEK
ncbi:MAG: tetratricopeptide repeat protein [Desulfatiglandaceae bacterium]